MAKDTTFDPRSDTVVLEYRGTEPTENESAGWQPALNGIPARDLTEADICRLVYTAALNEYDGSPDSPPMPDPERPSQAKARALVELLLSRKVDGRHVYGLAKKKTEPAETAATATPAVPADEPEARP